MKRRIGSVMAALLAALVLAGCGNSDSSDDTSGGADSSEFNDADVTFAQSMIPHHEQAVEMAKMAKAQASSSEVKALAAKIEAAQGPEIETLKGWLEDWGQETSSDSDEGGEGMGHGSDGSDMPGMMTGEDMTALENAQGAEFDEMFLTMMIEHHNSAIDMAETEQSEGSNTDAKALAEKIEADQTAEIAEMEKLLAP